MRQSQLKPRQLRTPEILMLSVEACFTMGRDQVGDWRYHRITPGARPSRD